VTRDEYDELRAARLEAGEAFSRAKSALVDAQKAMSQIDTALAKGRLTLEPQVDGAVDLTEGD